MFVETKYGRLTDAAVKQAIREYRRLKADGVYKEYGFRDSLMYDVVDPNGSSRSYPSKAIYGMAFAFTPRKVALRSNDFFGGTEAIGPLKKLDFTIRRKDDGYSDSDLKGFTRQSDKIAQRAIRIRRGQQRFRKVLLTAYGQKCAISAARTLTVLDAAHVRPHSQEGETSLQNGIVLRTDLHTLFDEQLLKIDPKTLRVTIDASVKDREYRKLDGHKISQPKNPAHRIKTEYLEDRWARD